LALGQQIIGSPAVLDVQSPIPNLHTHNTRYLATGYWLLSDVSGFWCLVLVPGTGGPWSWYVVGRWSLAGSWQSGRWPRSMLARGPSCYCFMSICHSLAGCGARRGCWPESFWELSGLRRCSMHHQPLRGGWPPPMAYGLWAIYEAAGWMSHRNPPFRKRVALPPAGLLATGAQTHHRTYVPVSNGVLASASPSAKNCPAGGDQNQ
jgi:hypothetical protein